MPTVEKRYSLFHMVKGTFLAFLMCLNCGLSLTGFAQQDPKANSSSNPSQPQTGSTSKPEQKGPSVDQVSPSYRSPEKDPFSDPKLVRATGAPAQPVEYPPLQERQAKWRERKNYNLDHGLPPPDQSEQYLVDEFEVKGIFVTDRGLGTLLKVKSVASTIFVREGAKFWNGSVTKIDKTPYRDFQKGTIAGTVTCSEVTLYSDNTVKTGQKSLHYIPKP